MIKACATGNLPIQLLIGQFPQVCKQLLFDVLLRKVLQFLRLRDHPLKEVEGRNGYSEMTLEFPVRVVWHNSFYEVLNTQGRIIDEPRNSHLYPFQTSESPSSKSESKI
jgi:hypothetical protein